MIKEYSFKKNTVGNNGYDVIKNGEYMGYVYKATTIDLSTFWKHNKDNESVFVTRKEAAEELLKEQ